MGYAFCAKRNITDESSPIETRLAKLGGYFTNGYECFPLRGPHGRSRCGNLWLSLWRSTTVTRPHHDREEG